MDMASVLSTILLVAESWVLTISLWGHTNAPRLYGFGRRCQFAATLDLSKISKTASKPAIHVSPNYQQQNFPCRADQDTDLSEMLKIRNVPLFQFYKENELLEQFATRDKGRIGNAINRHVGWEVCHFWLCVYANYNPNLNSDSVSDSFEW